MRVPATASPEVQQAFRDVWAALETFAAPGNVNLAGRRIMNAGSAIDHFDYVTRFDVDKLIADAFEAYESREETETDNATHRFGGEIYFTQFAKGSVLFTGLHGHLEQDNTGFYFDQANEYLALGMNTPAARLHIRVKSLTPTVYLDAYKVGAWVIGRRANNKPSLPTAVLSGETLLQVGARGALSTGFVAQDGAYCRMAAAEDWTGSAQGTTITFGTTEVLSTTPGDRWQVTDSGDWMAVNTALNVSWSTRSRISSPSDGIVLFRDWAKTSFLRLSLGGTTASFPALARNGTSLDVLLADGSAYTTIGVATVAFGGYTSSFAKWTTSGTTIQALLADGSAYTNLTLAQLNFGGTTSSYPALRRYGGAVEVVAADGSAYDSIAVSRVYFGGYTSSYPAFFTSTTTIRALLADGSAYADLQAKSFQLGTKQTYAASNVTTDRTYDADATSTAELADVLGTLIADLRTAGLVA